MSKSLMKQSTLFRKSASYFQDHSDIYINRGFNAVAGQGLWEDKDQVLYKLSVVNDILRQEFYIYLQMGKREDVPTKVVVNNVSGMKESIKKYLRGQEQFKLIDKITKKLSKAK